MTTTDTQVITVTELNQRSKALLEQNLSRVQVTGEISNWMRASSGHCYFTLKDQQAAIRCAFFRGQASRLRFKPSNGTAVVLSGQVSLYTNRGDYQLIVSHMEEEGMGKLAILFAQLKKKLQEEGLFNAEHKRPIPTLPKQIGIICSPKAAAFQDIKKVLYRRFPLIPFKLYPSAVQGQDAPLQLTQALEKAIQDNESDVIIIARGGGSIEDLWAFNDESLARAIHSCPIPILSGVGHEIDFTLVDFVADCRAATPSAAAEQAVPDQSEVRQHLHSQRMRIQRDIAQQVATKKSTLAQLKSRLIHPKQSLQNQMQRLDFLRHRHRDALLNQLNQSKDRLCQRRLQLNPINFLDRVKSLKDQQVYNQSRLLSATQKQLDKKRQHLALLSLSLNQNSPLSTLSKGYSILYQENQGDTPIASIRSVQSGDQLTARLHDGTLSLSVNKISAID